ncbi:MAG: hypothetical protein Q4A45_03320 [Clostridia bacterium]|nr:hypothetical protein [Clostridia bacterium]
MIYDIFIRWLIPFVCGAFISGIVFFFKNQKKRNSAMAVGIQCLLRAEIIRSYEKYSERGYCPIDIKEAVQREYAAYHDLGGNDVATHLVHEMLELPAELN